MKGIYNPALAGLSVILFLLSFSSAQAATCVDLKNNLRYRSTDEQTGGLVTTLQNYLYDEGYLNVESTGFFGRLTFSSVRAFQADWEIPTTGLVGPLTRAKIKGSTCTSVAPTKRVPWPVAANNESRDYTWSESYTLLSLVLDAERTEDTSYLAEAHDRILAVLAARDDKRSVFSRKPSWSFTDLTSKSCPVADPGTDAMVLYPMTRYLLAIKKLALEGDAKWDFATIRDAVIESVRGHRINWNTNGYRSPADAKDCYLDSAGRKMYDFGLEPFNLDAAMGSVHANLYALTGNSEDRDKAAVIAQQLESQITKLPDGTWVWPYWRASPEPEDTGHAYIELDFIDQAYEAGIAFTFSDLAAITKTLALKVFPASGGMASFVSGEGLGNGDESLAGMYLPFSSTDSNLMGRITAAHDRSKARTSSLGYGLLTRSYAARVENRPYGAACRVDDQCVTGSCFAGKVCGYPLSNTSTCFKHSDCASGWCTGISGAAGKCLDRPAAQASATSMQTETVSERGNAVPVPAGYPWPNFYGKGMTYTVETAAEVQDAADSGFRIIMLDIYRNIPADIHNVIKRNGLKFIVRDLQYRALECQSGACDREKIMAEARADIASMTDPDMIGFYILDDPTFDGEAIAKDIHAVVAESNQTSATKRPTICGIAGYLNWHGQSVASTTEYRIVTDRAIRNFSPQGCDIVAPYAYAETYVHVSDPSQVDWKMTSLLPYIKTGLAAKGWNINSIPMIGIPQAFYLTAPGVVRPRPEDLTDQAEAYCKAGATALMPFTWDYNGGILTTGQPPYLLMFNTPWLKQSMINGLARCASYWAHPGTGVTPPELLIRAFDPGTQAWVDGSPVVRDNSLVPLTTIPTISVPYNAEPYFQWGASWIQSGTCRLARTPGADNAFSIYALGAKGGNTIYYGDFQNTSKGGGNITIPHTYAFSCSDPTGATLWSTSIIVNVAASQASLPTATLTINGKTSDTVSVGDPFKYEWSSTNADTFSSNYSVTCTDGRAWTDSWAANTAQDSHFGTIASDAAGCTYKVTYKAAQSATGKEATKTIEVIVRALPATPIRVSSATASNSYDNYVPANIVDADESTGWISGGHAEQWIELDFGAQKTLSSMSLVVEQSPSGNTVHEIYAGTTPNPTTLVHTLSGFTQSADVLKATFSPALTNIRYVRVKTVASPSWVAWQTIKFNDEPIGMSRKTGLLANVIGALSESFSTRPASAVSDPDLGFSYHFTLDLYRGQEGKEVRALQEALKIEGLFNNEISGNFYDQTLEAVMKFQEKYGINPTGYVGPATRAQLNALFSL